MSERQIHFQQTQNIAYSTKIKTYSPPESTEVTKKVKISQITLIIINHAEHEL